MSRVLGRRWAVCGAAAVWAVMTRESRSSKESNSRGRTPPGSLVWGPLGAFDFSTRIKPGIRKLQLPQVISQDGVLEKC